MNVNFDKKAFQIQFAKALKKLAGAEKITKEVLRDMSRDVLRAHHATEDIIFINELIPVLSPKNRSITILFFKEFSGFMWDKETQRFVKKSKKNYDNAHAAAMAFLEDPHKNLWTWAEKELKEDALKVKPSLVEGVEKYVHNLLPKAKKAGVSEADILAAVFRAGVSTKAVVAAFMAMGEPVPEQLAGVEAEKQNEEAPM